MGKKLKYKAFSKFNSIIYVDVAAIILLGVSYGHWSNNLTVNLGVTTGALSVEEIIDEIKNSAIKVEIVKLEPNQSDLGYYKGSANIVFSIENTGDVAALISLNKNIINDLDQNTWIRFMNRDTVLSECFIPVESKKFNVNIVGKESTVIPESLEDVEEFLLGVGERATITLKECEFEVVLGETLEQLEVETQVSLTYKDKTGAWYGDTNNSLYIKQPLSELYDLATLEIMEHSLMPEEELGADIPVIDVPVTLPLEEEELGADVPVTLPIEEEELGVDIPVTLPIEEEEPGADTPEADIPVTLPVDKEESEADVPVTIPVDKEEPGADISVTLPVDKEEPEVGIPATLPLEEEKPEADVPVTIPLEEEVKGEIPTE